MSISDHGAYEGKGPHWRFGRVYPVEKQHGVTQRDQFSNEQIAPTDALVREALQNSVDAHRAGHQTRVSFRISTWRGADADYFKSLLRPLTPHWKAAGWRIPTCDSSGDIKALTIEDFGTTGLTGSTTTRDGGNFDSFWRRIGLSTKSGRKGGRWGLGKTVYASASRAGTFFGLSVPEATQHEPILMGECTLDPHSIGDDQYRPYGYFALHHDGHMPQPIHHTDTIEEFRSHAGLHRRSEPGLSLVIPHIRDTDATDIMRAIAANYYFPIVLGDLIVDVNDRTLSRSELPRLAAELGTRDVPFGFLEAISRRRRDTPDIEGDEPIGPSDPNETYFDQEASDRLRRRYDAGRLVQVRLPVTLTPRREGQRLSWIDLFLQRATDDLPEYAVFVRGNMVVPGERRWAPAVGYAAMVADDNDIVQFLGDAENPAHTDWNERAEKLRAGWRGHANALRAVRHSLRNLHRLLVTEDRTPDHTALAAFFPRPGDSDSPSALGTGPPAAGLGNRAPDRPVQPIVRARRPWAIRPRKGGFSIVPGTRARECPYPYGIRILVAYDVPRGNPFKRYSLLDFDLGTSVGITKSHAGVTIKTEEDNSVEAVLMRPDFAIEFLGFDTERDLVVRVEAVS